MKFLQAGICDNEDIIINRGGVIEVELIQRDARYSDPIVNILFHS